MTDKITIEKLHGSENYASWSNDLSIILNHYERWSWIEGEHQSPPSEMLEVQDPKGGTSTKSTNPDYTTWKKGANKTMFHIVMTCKQKVKDQIRCIMVLSEVWKRLKELYEPLNASMQFDHLSSIWNNSLDDYSSVTEYCSALEIVASNFAASGPTEFPRFNSHVLALIAFMGLPPSYKVTQHNILSKVGSGPLMLDSIKADLLNKERLLARENKSSNRLASALQIHRSNDRTS